MNTVGRQIKLKLYYYDLLLLLLLYDSIYKRDINREKLFRKLKIKIRIYAYKCYVLKHDFLAR